ncbi:Aste57867_23366 [Aphanomyces stellatus]|uniref:Aste57867_23366 protein n=1 Tax=Aphanomyces stellatus TaxID=120398 RepID=A0A485LP67_9STRA|nr:hypothetical protein As57867_023295 [Aphanomyces stellatus]VFU00012.1 Aste57867_23366 [Aphanomyces stellatus]
MVKYVLLEELHHFRSAESEEDIVQALALIAVLLLAPDDRAGFADADGATAIGDHLVRLCHEQGGAKIKWRTSNVFGFVITKKLLPTFVRYALVCIIHATLDASMAQDLCSMGLPQLLLLEFIINPVQELEDIVSDNQLSSSEVEDPPCHILALEALRNLVYLESETTLISHGALDAMWHTLLQPSEREMERLLMCDVLTNLTSHSPRATFATKDRLALLLALLLNENAHGDKISDHSTSVALQTAMADFGCNLARDTEYSIVFICTLEAHRPRARMNQSSIAFLGHWADTATDEGLSASLRSFTHNLAWTDVSTKVCVQKLSASSFVERFIGVKSEI